MSEGPFEPEILSQPGHGPQPSRDELLARLDRLEARLDQTQKGSGGVGCCGGLALLYIIWLLWQILERLPR